ncbi:hypothetical protein [Streptomyces sp. NPDC101234]|uniref:hypothetical protein n=1 Tax=Streptomyces sp. NPDC101234 TaxID=3366138 RepID=UPI00380BAA2E
MKPYIAACRAAMQEYPIWCLPDDLVHITIEMNAAAPSEQISADQRARLVAALQARLTGFAPFTVLCGSPLANRSGAILDTHPDQRLAALRNLARAALWEVHDSPAVAHEGGRGHASLGYAYARADSDPLQSALRRISPSHAPLAQCRDSVGDLVRGADVSSVMRFAVGAGWCLGEGPGDVVAAGELPADSGADGADGVGGVSEGDAGNAHAGPVGCGVRGRGLRGSVSA